VKQGEELKALDCTIMYITEYIYTQCFIRITQFLLVFVSIFDICRIFLFIFYMTRVCHFLLNVT